MKILSSLLLGALLVFFVTTHAQKPAANLYHLLVGTYTNGKSEGIYVYSFDAQTGDATYEHTIKGIENPSYLALSPDNKYVYSVSESKGQKGEISAYAFDAHSGMLTYLNRESSGSEGPCYVSVDQSGKYVFSGNYSGGSLAAFPVRPDGSLGASQQTIFHQGSSVNKERQATSHVHSVILAPENNYLMVPDLGMDKVMIYKFKPTETGKPLVPGNPPYVALSPGSGPRHFIFHPNHKFAYLIQEMSGTITAFKYNSGKLSQLQSITMLPENFKGKIGAADIHLSPDSKFLYGSNRGDANDIVIYAVNQKTGLLSYAGRQSALGDVPRNFMIDPTGNFLLVANQNSDNIIIFKRDSKTGLLTPTGKKIDVGSPVCLKMAAKN